MASVTDIEDAVARLGRADLLAFRVWLEGLVAERLRGEARDGPIVRRDLISSAEERARLIAEARECSRTLRDDPFDKQLIEELIDLQAENGDALEP